jgi:hypothetical protein
MGMLAANRLREAGANFAGGGQTDKEREELKKEVERMKSEAEMVRRPASLPLLPEAWEWTDHRRKMLRKSSTHRLRVREHDSSQDAAELLSNNAVNIGTANTHVWRYGIYTARAFDIHVCCALGLVLCSDVRHAQILLLHEYSLPS